jgi:hypothetical protein
MVNMHYCMGKSAGTSFGLIESTTKKCGKCGMEKSNKKGKSCCHDSKKLLKNVVDQNIVYNFFNIQHPIIFVSAIKDFEFISELIALNAKLSNYSHAPPDQLVIPIYIEDCSFLI